MAQKHQGWNMWINVEFVVAKAIIQLESNDSQDNYFRNLKQKQN